MKSLLPIRKVAVGLVAALLAVGARKVLHIDLGDDVLNGAAENVVGFAAAWAVNDPRVKAIEAKVETVIATPDVQAVVSSPIAALVAAQVEQSLASDPDLQQRVTDAALQIFRTPAQYVSGPKTVGPIHPKSLEALKAALPVPPSVTPPDVATAPLPLPVS